jgi:hypothetical protein
VLYFYGGSRHCAGQSVTFLAMAWPPGKAASSIDAGTVRQYVRDPDGAYRQVSFRSSFARGVPLPRMRVPPATTTAPTPCGSARPTPTATCTSKAPTAWNAGHARPTRSTAPDHRQGRLVADPLWMEHQIKVLVPDPLTGSLNPKECCGRRAGLGHPVGHPDDPTGSFWIRRDRRGTQREQGRSVWIRPDRR